MKKPEIIIVDDHQIFRQGLRTMITIENIATVIAEASNGKEFIELLAHHKPDLVLLDIDMPLMNGMEAMEKALRIIPDLKVIVFTMFDDETHYYKMIDLGVRGFILKSSGLSELERAINQVMNGESHFSNEILRKIISNFSRKSTQKPGEIAGITEREMDILRHICMGCNNEEISQKLFISPMTVKTHRSNLLEKTCCKNTPALILYAIKNKIVEL